MFRTVTRASHKGRVWTSGGFVVPKTPRKHFERFDTITRQFLDRCLVSNGGSVSAGPYRRTQPYLSKRFYSKNIGASLRNLARVADIMNADARSVKAKREKIEKDFQARLASASSSAEADDIRVKLADARASSDAAMDQVTISALKMVQKQVSGGGLHNVGELNGHLVVNLLATTGPLEHVDHCNVAMVCSKTMTGEFLREEYSIDSDSARLSLISSLKAHKFYGIGYQSMAVIENMLCEYGRYIKGKQQLVVRKHRWFDSYAQRKGGVRLIRVSPSTNQLHLFRRGDETGQEIVFYDPSQGVPSVSPRSYLVPMSKSVSPEVLIDPWWKSDWIFRPSHNEKSDWIEIKDQVLFNKAKQKKKSDQGKGKRKGKRKGNGCARPASNVCAADEGGFIPSRWSPSPPKAHVGHHRRYRSQIASLIWSMNDLAHEAEHVASSMEFQELSLAQQTTVLAREGCLIALERHPDVYDDYLEPYFATEDVPEDKIHPDERLMRSFSRLAEGKTALHKESSDDDAFVPTKEEARKLLVRVGKLFLLPLKYLDRLPRDLKHRFDCISFIQSATKVRDTSCLLHAM